jgi:hypothetical protein
MEAEASEESVVTDEQASTLIHQAAITPHAD